MKKEIEIPEGKEIDFEKSTIVLKEKTNEKEKLFLELIQGLEMKSDKKEFPDSVFCFKGDTLMLEIEKDYLWVSYYNIWSIFEDKFDMGFSEIQSFIKEMVEKYSKWVGLTPGLRFKTPSPLVEKHSKWVEMIPTNLNTSQYYVVEKHFKWEGLTPKTNVPYSIAKVEKHFNS